MQLSDFLLQRIAEDEAVAEQHRGLGFARAGWSDEHVDRHLAECEAKRLIVDTITIRGMYDWGALDDEGRILLRLLALPYADHSDYDEVWRV